MSKRTAGRFGFSSVLVVGSLLTPLAAPAQEAPQPAPVSVRAANAPVATVLRSLFHGAGIRNFVIDDSVQGNVNADLSAVPFSVALKQVLGSVVVPLTFSVENGVYHVKVRQIAQAIGPDGQPGVLGGLPSGVARFPNGKLEGIPFLIDGDTPESDSAGPLHLYKIGIKHYDPGVIAELLTHQTGIVDVPPNFVIPSGASSSGANAPSARPGLGITTVGGPSAFGPPVPLGGAPALTGPQSAPAGGNAVLPDGVKRIFVRHSDNSLVIEATPEGMARILPLIKETD